VGLPVGKLDTHEVVNLTAKYQQELLRLIRYYPQANCYAYYREDMSGYGFVRDTAIEIIGDYDE